LKKKLYKHVTENNILGIEQLGFKEYSSTEKATHKLIKYEIDEITKNLHV